MPDNIYGNLVVLVHKLDATQVGLGIEVDVDLLEVDVVVDIYIGECDLL